MLSDNKQRPGVMVYFDSLRPALNRLSDEQCGVLFRAILDYAQYGTTTELDPMTGMVFDLLVPKIDRDGVKYEESREQRKYAVYTREAKRRGETPVTIAEWRMHQQMLADIGPMHTDNGSYPSASASVSTLATASVNPPLSASAAGEEAAEGCKGGEERENLHSCIALGLRQWKNMIVSGHSTLARSFTASATVSIRSRAGW